MLQSIRFQTPESCRLIDEESFIKYFNTTYVPTEKKCPFSRCNDLFNEKNMKAHILNCEHRPVICNCGRTFDRVEEAYNHVCYLQRLVPCLVGIQLNKDKELKAKKEGKPYESPNER